MASIKNCQLLNGEDQVLQFGRVGKDEFSMDVFKCLDLEGLSEPQKATNQHNGSITAEHVFLTVIGWLVIGCSQAKMPYI